MTPALVLTVVLATGVGAGLGLLGGGGSILAVPLLVYVAGLPAKEAIATSLLVVGATSAAGLIPHVRAGRVRWRTGAVLGLAGMAGAYPGGRLAAHVPDGVLLTGFALMMLATATAMLCRRSPADRPAGHGPSLPHTVLIGVAIGLTAGMVGAGGGFLIVPALILAGVAAPAAVGTSLLVIAMQSAAGLAGHLAAAPFPAGLAAAVTAAAVIGSLLGGRLAGRLSATALRTTFAWFVVVMGTLVLTQRLAHLPRVWVVAGAVAVALVFVALAALNRGRGARRWC